MLNDRLRDALRRNGLTPEMAAASVGVDTKTVERWITQGRTPYPRHRHTLAALVDESESVLWPLISPQRQFADVTAVFPTRAEFIEAMPTKELFKEAKSIDIAGLSLNLLCQQYSDTGILKLLDAGATIRCLFLDPNGVHIRDREIEEGHAAGVLTNLTELNMQSLMRVRKKAPPQCPGAIFIRTYDEPIRFNITIVDRMTCVMQPYLPNARGVESPTFVARRSQQPGLFDTFTQVFETMWANETEASRQ